MLLDILVELYSMLVNFISACNGLHTLYTDLPSDNGGLVHLKSRTFYCILIHQVKLDRQMNHWLNLYIY